MKTILNVLNDIFYKRANFQFEYFLFWSTQKWQMYRSEYIVSNLQILYDFVIFCLAHNTKNFAFWFCMFVGYIMDYIQNFFQFILKLSKYFLDFFQMKRALERGSTNNFPLQRCLSSVCARSEAGGELLHRSPYECNGRLKP